MCVWNWPTEWFQKYPVLYNIQVPVLNDAKEDKMVWNTNDGKRVSFSIRSIWKDMNEGHKIKWNSMVWFTQCIPKHSFVLWMAVQERLLTQDKIMKWKPNDTLVCALCEHCNDSHEHLLFQCQYSAKVWRKLQEVMNVKFSNNWSSIVREYIQLKDGNMIWSIVRRLVCGAAVYYVWLERNARLFGEAKRDEAFLCQEIMDTVRMKIMSLHVRDSMAVKSVELKWNVKLHRVKNKG
ncbi:reverse transcriptase zinc-binding domain-containing protein [Tanacetum coccineum]